MEGWWWWRSRGRRWLRGGSARPYTRGNRCITYFIPPPLHIAEWEGWCGCCIIVKSVDNNTYGDVISGVAFFPQPTCRHSLPQLVATTTVPPKTNPNKHPTTASATLAAESKQQLTMISRTSTPPLSRTMTNISPSVHPIVTSRPRSDAVPGACAALSKRVSEMVPPAQLHTRRVGIMESLEDIWEGAEGLKKLIGVRAQGWQGGSGPVLEMSYIVVRSVGISRRGKRVR